MACDRGAPAVLTIFSTKGARFMSYKDLLVVLDSDAPARGRIEIAAALAERFAAHLVALYPLPVPEAPRHFGYYDPALLNPFFEEWRARAREAADETRELFEHTTGLHGVSAEWREVPEGAGRRSRGSHPLRRSRDRWPARSRWR